VLQNHQDQIIFDKGVVFQIGRTYMKVVDELSSFYGQNNIGIKK